MAVASVLHRQLRATTPAHLFQLPVGAREADIPAQYLGDHAARAGEDRLYPERNGMRCRIVSISADESYPLVLEFEDGFRGIGAIKNVRPLEREGTAS